MTIYEIAPTEANELAQSIIKEHYPELEEAALTIDFLMAFNNKTFPVKAGGYPALACIKNMNLMNRVKGSADVQITIDGEAWKSLSPRQKEALLSHEIHHVIIKRDKENNIKRDDIDRPLIKMKKHDYQMGWFRDIALRYGEDSPEVYQAKLLWKNDGKTFFLQV